MTDRPLPDIEDPQFAPFWQGTARCELRVPRCAVCRAYGWPPRPVCAGCHGMDFRWEPAPAHGQLYTWTVVAHQTMQAFPPPYVVGLVELAPGLRMLGNVVGVEPGALTVGLRLRAQFAPVAEAVTLVNWAPDDPVAVAGPVEPDG